MAPKNYQVNVGPTPQSIRDAERLNKTIRDMAKDVARITAAFKDLANVTKSIRFNSITGNRFGGLDGFLNGTAIRQQNLANQTGFLGTAQGQKINTLRQELSLGKQINQSYRDQLANERAMSLQLFSRKQAYKDITDVQKLSQMASDAERRAILESARGRDRQARVARQLNDNIRERIQLVREEARSPEAARNRKMDVLFGDSGAALFKVQAGLAFNYAMMNAARSAVMDGAKFTADLDMSLRNLQAIVRVTDNGMESLKESLIGVSEETKFTAVEVANAAVILGQAGLSVEEIKDATRAVSLLATATGTDLAGAVDIATSVLGVFNLESQSMITVANTITEAINSSKLNLEKLTLGLQYAGNTASQSGVRFEELTAALGAMANSGIRSGSTLGTGMRQILVSLQKPSGEFLSILERLGLTIYDVDIRSKGLYGALSTLKDAGFTSADAIRAFEVRAAAAYNALQNNLGTMIDLEQSFLGSNAAIAANQTQMRSFTNQWARFRSVLGSVIEEGGRPLLLLLRDLIAFTSDVLSGLRDWGPVLKALTVSTVAFATAWGSLRALSLVAAITGITGALKGMTLALAMSTAGVKGLGAAMAFIVGNPLIVATLGIATLAMVSFGRETYKLSDALDRARGKFDQSSGIVDQYSRKIDQVQGKITELRDRSQSLTENQELLRLETQKVASEFSSMGLTADLTNSTVNGLIVALQNLKAQLAQDYTLSIRVAIGDLESLISVNQAELRGLRSQFSAGLAQVLPAQSNNGTGEDLLVDTAGTPFQRLTLRNSEVRKGIDAANRVAQNPNSTFSEAQAVYGLLQAEATRLRGSDEESARLIDDFLNNQFQPILANKQEFENFSRILGQQRQEGNTNQFRQSGTFIQFEDQIGGMTSDISTNLERITKGTRGQSIMEKEGQVRQYEQNTTAALDALEAQIEASIEFGQLNLQAGQELLSGIVNARGQLSQAVEVAVEGADSVREEIARQNIARIAEEGGNFSRELSAAESIVDIDRLLAQELARIDQEMAAQRNFDEIKMTDPASLEVAELRRTGERDAARRRAELQAKQARESLLKKGRSGGGGSSDDPFDTFMDNLDAGLSSGLVNNDSMRLDFVMGTAREELKKLTGQINEFSGKQQLTVAQEKELVKLTEQHSKLKDWILKAEEKITEEKRRQGTYEIDVRKTLEDWKNSNLDFSATLEGGLSGTLSTLKTGFSDLFKTVTDGTSTGEEAFRNFGISVVQSLQNVISEMLAMSAMQAVIGMVDPSGTGTLSKMLNAVLPGKKEGGEVGGTMNRDSEPYMLMPGEYVVRRSAVQAVGVDYLDKLNSMGNRRMASGGHIGVARKSGGGMGEQNIWLVDERTKAPVPGPNDIIAVITDDMARNGPTRQLIRNISQGSM